MRRWTVGATLAAAGLGCAFFAAGYPTVIYDSWGYYYLTGILRTAGLGGWPTDTRTYGYPLFQALVTGWRALPAEEFRLVVFLAQLAAWLGVSAAAARRLASVFASPGLGAAAYVISALNPVLLVQTTEPLSDLISAALVLAALACSWRVPGETDRSAAWHALFAFLAAAFAVMIRPANVAVVAGLAVAWAVRALRWRDVGVRQAAAALAGIVAPLLPQVALNHQLYGTWNPLIQKNLYSLQASWGMGALKYATLVMGGRSPFLVYGNPLYRGDPTPGAFLSHHPFSYAGTLLLHGFALLDRDLPFTYVTDLAPWYRWPVSAVNLLLLYLAAAGAAVVLGKMLVRRRLDEPAFVALSTVLVGAATMALYLPVEVESRFGAGVQALSAPLIVAGAAALSGGAPARRRIRLLVLALAPLAVAGALRLSFWITRQRTNPFVESPANAFVMGPTRNHRTAPEP